MKSHRPPGGEEMMDLGLKAAQLRQITRKDEEVEKQSSHTIFQSQRDGGEIRSSE